MHTILISVKKFSRSHGVTASTLDSESSDPSSNLGETFAFWRYFLIRTRCSIALASYNLFLIIRLVIFSGLIIEHEVKLYFLIHNFSWYRKWKLKKKLTNEGENVASIEQSYKSSSCFCILCCDYISFFLCIVVCTFSSIFNKTYIEWKFVRWMQSWLKSQERTRNVNIKNCR